MSEIRLTQLSHGGGCGCKIAPAVLESIISVAREKIYYPNLLIGSETADDAAVYRLNDEQALIATTDFFMPIVDDPYDFGRIAATNALSDVYAMGGTPIMALAVVGMPVNVLPVEVIKKILDGGEFVCREAGIPLAGGHSIDSPEPIYGLVALGLVHPDQLKRNNAAQEGDVLIQGKALGVGILSHAMKKGLLSVVDYQQLIAATTQLNRVGTQLAALDGIHALTDVTGFGLVGHLLELCRGAGLAAQLQFAQIPILPAALPYAMQGIGPGAIERNQQSFGEQIHYADSLETWQRRLLVDPQTSGGLMAAVAPEVAEQVLSMFKVAGFDTASIVGQMVVGEPAIYVK